MVAKIILHIGLHRTGTSSFQAVMKEHADDFLKAGIDPYVTAQGRTHARELAFACLRPEVFKDPFDDGSKAAIRNHIDAFMAATTCQRVLISSEHLSLIRMPAEIEQLKSHFPQMGIASQILVVLREPVEWFASYKDQIAKEKNPDPKTDQSRKNVKDDSWVRDHGAMVALLRHHFETVTVLDYDKINMTSIMLRTLGVEPSFNTHAYRRNKRSWQDSIGRVPYRILRSVLGSEGHGPIKYVLRAKERFLRNRR